MMTSTIKAGVAVASLSFILLGCGGGAESDIGPDAGGQADSGPGGDASSDAGNTVTACSLSTRGNDLLVVLHNADGSVNDSVTTGEDGVASFENCPPNSMFSYAFQEIKSGDWEGLTVAGVQPGSDIEVVLPGSAVVTTAEIDVPEDGAVLTMVRASAGGSCAANTAEGATASIAVSPDCIPNNGTVLPVLATARIDQVSMYAYSTDVPTVFDGTTTVDNLSGWMTGPSISFTASNVPGEQLFFDFQSIREGIPYTGVYQLAYPEAGTAAHSQSMPPSGFTTLKRVGVSTGGAIRQGVQYDSTELAESFDMGDLLPAIGAFSVDNSDPARPIFTVGGTPAGTDLGYMASRWKDGNDDDVVWRVIYPAAQDSFGFPALPAEYAALTPDAASASSVTVFDLTGSDYMDILTRGYTVGEFIRDCPSIPAGQECEYSYFQEPN